MRHPHRNLRAPYPALNSNEARIGINLKIRSRDEVSRERIF